MKAKRILTFVLAAALCFGVVGCKGNPNSHKGEEMTTSATKPVSEPERHPVNNGLHNVTVRDTERVFTSEGTSEYKIVTDRSDNDCVKAALFIQQHVKAATGATLEIVNNVSEKTWSAENKYIVLDVPELFSAAGLSMPSEDLGQTGYYIQNAGNSVFIAINSPYGAQYGALSFLRHVIGYEMYAEDTVVYEKSGATLPDMTITERPDFEFYVQSNKVSADATYGMGFGGDIFIPVAGELWHNSLNYLPMETYKDKHPDWYSTMGNDLCYTAHGNQKELDAMVEELARKIIALLPEHPSQNTITITIEDHMDQCTCGACAKVREDYDGANSAAAIRLCNAVNKIVQKHLEDVAERTGTAKRDFNIIFFAYHKMEKAPVKKDADGNYVPIDDSVICDDNVGVYIAPITAAFNQSFYHESNAAAAETIKGWGALSDKLYIWLYETNFYHYLFPLNTYDVTIETYRLCKENNAVYMYNEGQWNQSSVTCFGKLKEYFNSRAIFNVNDTFQSIADDFFENYFRDAAEPMRRYFDALQAHLRYLETEFPADVNGNIYNNMAQSKLWPPKTLDGWLAVMDEAYAAIEHYRTEDPALFEKLESHILLETVFPRFAQIRLYPGKYSAATLRKMREDFRNDCARLNVTKMSENDSLDELFDEWGVK